MTDKLIKEWRKEINILEKLDGKIHKQWEKGKLSMYSADILFQAIYGLTVRYNRFIDLRKKELDL